MVVLDSPSSACRSAIRRIWRSGREVASMGVSPVGALGHSACSVREPTTRKSSGLGRTWSSLGCLVGARGGLERFRECVGVRCSGDLSQLATVTMWRGDTPLREWLAVRGRAVASRSSRLIGRHQPEVLNRSTADSTVCRWSPAQIIRQTAFVRRIMPDQHQRPDPRPPRSRRHLDASRRPSAVWVRQCRAMPAT